MLVHGCDMSLEQLTLLGGVHGDISLALGSFDKLERVLGGPVDAPFGGGVGIAADLLDCNLGSLLDAPQTAVRDEE